jgi:alpha/beta superfamily hydrolase
MVKAEEIWIKCEDATLYGEIYIPDVVPAPAVLICHGMDSQGFHFLKIYSQLAKTACQNGLVSLVFDFRGVGKSTGKFDYGYAEQHDVKCALNYLASGEEVQGKKIFIVGHSLGGVVSLYAVQNEKRVNGLVLWSTPPNQMRNVKKFIRRTRGKLGLYLFQFSSWIDKFFDVSRFFKLEVYGINLRPKNVKEKLMKLNGREEVSKLENMPLLIVAGDKDSIVDIDEARQLFLSAHEPKDFLIIPGADHIYNGKEDELIAQTIKWIKKWE